MGSSCCLAVGRYCLALPAALRLTQLNFVALDDGWQGRPGLSVYFQVTADTADIAAVQTLLQQNTSMIEVRLTDADQALQEFMAASADSKSLTTLHEYVVRQSPCPHRSR